MENAKEFFSETPDDVLEKVAGVSGESMKEFSPNNAPQKKRKTRGLHSQIVQDHIFCWVIYAWPIFWFIVGYIGVNLLGSVRLAFSNIDLFGEYSFAGLNNFKRYISLMFTDGDYLAASFKYSILMYVLNLVFTTFFNIVFAYLIFKKCRFWQTLRVICFLPGAISSMVFGLAFQKFVSTALPDIMMDVFGVTDYIDMFTDERYVFFILNFYMIWTGLTAALLVLPSAMSGISPELFDAGQMDGVRNIFQELWYIVVPSIWPTQMTYIVIGISSIFTGSGVSLLFYMYDAPKEAYNLGYYYTVLVKTASNDTFYPVLAAGGIMMSLINAPLVLLGKWLMEKFGWSDE